MDLILNITLCRAHYTAFRCQKSCAEQHLENNVLPVSGLRFHSPRRSMAYLPRLAHAAAHSRHTVQLPR